MPTYVTPGVYYEAVDADRARLNPARVDVCGFVGLAERGPLDTPVRLGTWRQFCAIFGSFQPVGMLAYALKGFFDNGGRTCHVVRVAAPVLDLALAPAPVVQPADRRTSVLADASALVPGAVVTVRQGELVHNYLAVDVDASIGTVTWDRPLDPGYDPAAPPPVLLATGGAAAGIDLPGDDGTDSCLRVDASSPGAWGGRLSAIAARTTGAATATTTAVQPSSRLFSLVASVAGFEAGTLVRLSQGGAPAVVSRRVVTSVDAARSRLGWDLALDPAYDLTKPILLEAEAFTLSVLRNGVTAEVFGGLSLRPEHSRFAPAVLAGSSALVRAGLPAAAPGPYVLPEPGAARPLRSGRDGTAGLRLVDVLGDPSDPLRRGLRAYEVVPEPALLAIPDLVAEPVPAVAYAPPEPPEVEPCCPQPPPEPALPAAIDPVLVEGWHGFPAEQILAAQERIVTVCETSDRVALLDPARLRTQGGNLDLAGLMDWRSRLDSSYAALHAPWVRVLDPMGPTGGDPLRSVPPSGHVAGVIGRVDAERGPSEAPANELLTWVQELDCEINGAEHGVLNPAGVSCLRPLTGRGLRVYGARTLSLEGNLRYLNVRRMLLAIRRTLRAELQWAVFEPADPTLRRLLVVAISGYLFALWERGALAGAEPDEAFFVRADDELNPPEDAGGGRVVVEAGVAVVLPAEFVLLRVGRTEAGLEMEEVS